MPTKPSSSAPSCPLTGWGLTMVRVYKEAGKDNLGLISAGVAYYGFLTLIPALGALVLTYGLVTDPGEVATQMRAIVQHVPAEAAKLIDDQLDSVVTTATGKEGSRPRAGARTRLVRRDERRRCGRHSA